MTLTQRNQQLALGFFGLFGILAILIKMQFEPLISLDHQWLTAFSGSSLGQHIRVWEWLTLLGSPLVTGGLAVVLALFLWRIRQVGWSVATLVGIIGGDGLLLALKDLVGRVRPLQPVVADSGFSFPSGHVFSTALVAGIVITLLYQFLKGNAVFWSVTAVIVMGVIAIMLARLGLRNHFPSDVLGSVLLASGWWLQVVSVYERVVQRWRKIQAQE
ncbi:phosphatase PAP2 family protein [Levilactobacillus yiduensis]|uniref:phosphatase PAP2 family protein n=1 Tax=Levilactobacillus yiduensis TaxID=2953880 RepID=UPI000EF31E32|nr:phosphatase PAP2 family protein [Levilactobacillus yiduensis]AYM03820.1 phosphatase PAP2 family protein [Levilactobacillus brevis]